ncbi:cytochrome c oxidase assembly factor 1 family protein [Mesorhizobium sp. AR02]|uniref:cytochrome c oxidase assembly factor 1 family protein n=1 Tax=Mesorhizobium sp. AR02 TaxID=2865837 RepID=UPI00215F9C8C|nr:cytochrome c oxidase assembly factor 1 family protein [Mesorhizobium sp. AR02]UVK52348.1 cytochrome c oxidase assembly factor 1 family protein [Mesorhizobium sp. AR02]
MAGQPLNQPAEIPAELDRWNWGAFFLNWIWGIGNSTFIALLMFVPLVNIVMLFVLGAKGSRWAWQNVSWRDAEHFRRVQRNWAIAGFIVFVVGLVGIAAVVGIVPRLLKSSDAYRLTMETVRADDRVKTALGDDVDAGYWVLGSVQTGWNGSGDAQLSIPIHGSHGWGWVMSHAVRSAGKWNLRLLVVMAGGAPIVLVDEDHFASPDAVTKI